MAQREPKSQTTTSISVKGRSGGRKGRLEITSGNLYYFRTDAKDETERWSLQQIIELLEKDIALQTALGKRNLLPRNKQKNDFTIFVTDVEGSVVEENSQVISESHPLRAIEDQRKLEHGAFQIDYSYRKKPPFGFTWSVRIGLHTAIYILDLYVSKWLSKKRGDTATDANVTISKAEFKGVIHRWLAQLGA